MTRDEAIKILDNTIWPGRFGARPSPAAKFVDAFTALGLLKIEPPKTPREKFVDAMLADGYVKDSIGVVDALAAIDKAGLAIVEK